jgi:activating signal cointegrator complex subunit 2
MVAFTLPLFPSGQARKSLSASHLSRLNESIASALQGVLELPINKADLPSARAFVASYAKESAHETLERLTWEQKSAGPTTHERLIRSRSLELAKRLAGVSGGVSLETLTDVSIAYAQKNKSRVRDIWSSALKTEPHLLSGITSDLVTSFTSLLDTSTMSQVGLTGTRKAVYCIICVLHSAPTDILSAFWKNIDFMTSLAKAYDTGLLEISRMYGGLQHLTGSSSKPDDWEVTWMESKTALLDSFHVLLRHMLEAVGGASPSTTISAEGDRAFEVIFAIMEIVSSPDRDLTVQRTPFYNQSLIEDYDHAYNMEKTLNASLRRADSARMDLLEHQLRSLESPDRRPGDLGALKLLIRSDGMVPAVTRKPDIESHGVVSAAASASSSSQPASADPQTESQVAQVRELLPDYSEAYIRALLIHPDYPFRGNPERVIEALLEGRAPPPDEIEPAVPQSAAVQPLPIESWTYTAERRNVFDEEHVDMSKLRIGKQP